MLTREQKIQAKALYDVVVEKQKNLTTNGAPTQVRVPAAELEHVINLSPTPIQVNNQVDVASPSVSVPVTVDLAALTSVLERAFAVLVETQRAVQEELATKNEMLSQLVQVLSEQQAPVVKVRAGDVAAPVFPLQPPRPKALRLEVDSDGTKRVIPEY